MNQMLALFRAVSEYASFAFKGSSTINVSAPKPVSVAPIEEVIRKPPLSRYQFVVSNLDEPCSEDPAVHLRIPSACGIVRQDGRQDLANN